MSESDQRKIWSSPKGKWLSIGLLAFCLLVFGIIFLFPSKEKLKQTWIIGKALAKVRFSPDNKIAIGSFTGNNIGIINPKAANLHQKFNIPFENVKSISFSNDGSLMAVGGGETFGKGMFLVWDFKSNKVVNGMSFESELSSLDISPDGNFLAFTIADKSFSLVNLKTNDVEKLNGHSDGVPLVAFSPNGNLLASSSQDRTVRIWDVKTKQTVQIIKDCGVKDCGVDFAFSPDGKLIATSDKEIGVIKIFEVETGKNLKTISWSTEKYDIAKILFLNDSKTIAVAGGVDLAKPGEVRIYNVETGELKQLLTGHRGIVTDLTFSPSENLLISSGAVVEDSNTVYGEVKVWDITKF